MKQILHKSMNDPSVWSHRDMRLVLPSRALSFFGDSIAFVVLSLRISESEQPALMTLLFIAFALPLFALSGVAGRLVDEHDSRRLLVGAGALQVVASLGLVMAPNVPAMLGCVLLLQTGQAVTGPTWAALVPRIVGDALVGRAVGLQQTLSAMAGLAGAAVGGVLYDLLGYSVTLLLDTATFASLVVVAETVRTRRGRRYDVVTGHEANSADRDADAAISGRQFILKDSLLRLLVPALCLFILAAEATNVVEVFLITDDLGASAAMYGVAMAAYMLGQISGPLLAGRVLGDASRIGWTAASAAVIGVAMVVNGVSPSIWLVVGVLVVAGVAGGALNALIGAMLVTRPPEHMRGRVLAAVSGISRGFSVVAMVLGGVSGQYLGARMTFVLCGVVSVAVSGLVLRARRVVVEARPVVVTDRETVRSP
jgi:MFS family permease